jgi:hypothetical protein
MYEMRRQQMSYPVVYHPRCYLLSAGANGTFLVPACDQHGANFGLTNRIVIQSDRGSVP